MFVLNNVATSDDYSDEATLQCPGTTEVNLLIYNAAVYVQYAFRTLGYTAEAPIWSPPEGVFFPPGERVRGRNIEQIRVRSAVAGKPAQVTIEAVA